MQLAGVPALHAVQALCDGAGPAARLPHHPRRFVALRCHVKCLQLAAWRSAPPRCASPHPLVPQGTQPLQPPLFPPSDGLAQRLLKCAPHAAIAAVLTEHKHASSCSGAGHQQVLDWCTLWLCALCQFSDPRTFGSRSGLFTPSGLAWAPGFHTKEAAVGTHRLLAHRQAHMHCMRPATAAHSFPRTA